MERRARNEDPAGGIVRAVDKPRGMLEEPLLRAEDVGRLLGGIPKSTVLALAREERLPCLRIGKHVRFVRSERTLERQRERFGYR